MNYLTPEQVETVRDLVASPRLASHLADTVIASAFLTGDTPRKLLSKLLANYPITDEDWRSLIAPELAWAMGEQEQAQ